MKHSNVADHFRYFILNDEIPQTNSWTAAEVAQLYNTHNNNRTLQEQSTKNFFLHVYKSCGAEKQLI